MDRTSNAALEGAIQADGRRVPAIDIARGIAVAAMVVYHTAWDLSELRLVAVEVTAEPGWRAFARAIAAGFLVLVGIGLALAHRDGIRMRAFLRRLATVAGAALVITVATAFVFPDSYIFFGILHAIALTSVLALPFVRWPAWAAALAALAIGGATLLPAHPVFDAPILAFLGLGARVPSTNDWVPVFPWSAFVFAGIAAAKLAAGRLPSLPAPGRIGRALAWTGRHSLIIYLLHQPLLFGALSGIAQLTGPNPAALAAPFLRSCARSCVEQGQPETVCRATCTCTADALKDGPIWPKILGGRLSVEENRAVASAAQACFQRLR